MSFVTVDTRVPFGCLELGTTPVSRLVEGRQRGSLSSKSTTAGGSSNDHYSSWEKTSSSLWKRFVLDPAENEDLDLETDCGSSVCGGGSLNSTPWPSPELPQLKITPEGRSRIGSEDEIRDPNKGLSEVPKLKPQAEEKELTHDDKDEEEEEEEEKELEKEEASDEKIVFAKNWGFVGRGLARIFEKEKEQTFPTEEDEDDDGVRQPESPVQVRNWKAVGNSLAGIFKEISEADFEELEFGPEECSSVLEVRPRAPVRPPRPHIPPLNLDLIFRSYVEDSSDDEQHDQDSEKEDSDFDLEKDFDADEGNSSDLHSTAEDEDEEEFEEGRSWENSDEKGEEISTRNWRAVGIGLADIFREEATALSLQEPKGRAATSSSSSSSSSA